jgi:hypothetical protein
MSLYTVGNTVNGSPSDLNQIINGLNGTNDIGALTLYSPIAAPGAPTTAINGVGNLTGAYKYKVAFVTGFWQGPTGTGTLHTTGNTSGGALSSISLNLQKTSITNIPIGGTGVVGRVIYRTKSGGSIYYLLATIDDNVTNSWPDNAIDSTLVTVMPTSNTTGSRFVGDGSGLTNVGSVDHDITRFGAVGDGTTDALAAFTAAMAGGFKGTVYVPAGTFVVSGTIVVTADILLKLGVGAVLKPTGNFNLIEIRGNGSYSGLGGKLDVSGVSTFSNACIYMNSDYFTGDTTTRVEHLYCVSASRRGKGIYIYSELPMASGAASWLSYVRFLDLDFQRFNKAIHLKTFAPPGALGTWCWINGNTFDQITMFDCIYGIHQEGSPYVPTQIGGNYFTNIQYQPTSNSLRAILCDGFQTYFRGILWDVADSAQGIVVEFTANSVQNVVESAVTQEGTEYLDYGTNNRLWSPDNMSIQRQMIPPTLINGDQFVGDQDDFLAYANKRFTVTQTGGPAPFSGSVANLFNPIPGQIAMWGTVLVGNPVIIEIDMTSDQAEYLTVLGMLFSWDEYPTNIKFESYNGTSWSNFGPTYTHNTTGWVIATQHQYQNTKVRVTFSVAAAASGNIGCSRWFGQSSSKGGQMFITRNGGTIYNDLEVMDATKGIILKSPDLSRWRVTVNNAGALITTKL